MLYVTDKIKYTLHVVVFIITHNIMPNALDFEDENP